MTTDLPENTSKFEELLRAILGPDLVNLSQGIDCLSVEVYGGAIVRCLTILHDNPQCRFLQLTDITAVDFPSRNKRFELVYHLLSHEHNRRLRIKILLGEETFIPSVSSVFPSANWYEREVWDMFGIMFQDHPDLRRILTDYNFSGHPLRKDFPLSGHVQVRFDEEQARVIYEPVKLDQSYRSFDFETPWEGILDAPSKENQKIAPKDNP